MSDPFGPMTEMHAPAPLRRPVPPPSLRWPARPRRALRRARRWVTRLALTTAWALTLSGCGTTPAPRSQPLQAPVALTQPCQAPPPLTEASGPALLDNHIEAMRRFAQCAARHRQLSRWIESQNASQR